MRIRETVCDRCEARWQSDTDDMERNTLLLSPVYMSYGVKSFNKPEEKLYDLCHRCKDAFITWMSQNVKST